MTSDPDAGRMDRPILIAVGTGISGVVYNSMLARHVPVNALFAAFRARLWAFAPAA